jgi:tellurite resistance protein
MNEKRAAAGNSIQASAFGIVLGVYGLGRGWTAATGVWSVPPAIGSAILVGADCVWLLLLVLYVVKWVRSRAHAWDELGHPIKSCYVDLVFSSTLLVSMSVLEFSRNVAVALAVAGWAGHCVFTVWRAGNLWRGARRQDENTAVLFLPQITGNFISALAAGTLGYSELAALFFGAGALSWVPVEALILGRLYSQGLPPSLRPTLGIRLSPPATACVAYLTLHDGTPDFLVQCLLGYGFLQAAILLRLSGWIRAQDFVPTYWGFSFGIVALGWSALSVARLGRHGIIEFLALPLFVVENLIIGVFLVLTMKLIASGNWFAPQARLSREMRADLDNLERDHETSEI